MKIGLKVFKRFEVYKGFVVGFVIIFALLMPSSVQAISLGSVTKNNFAEVSQGNTAEFTILFWNTENSSYKLALRTEQVPKKWTVIMNPEEIVMNQSKIGPPYDDGENIEYVNSPQGNVKAVPVKVYVKVPISAKPETYELIIRANTHPLATNTSELTSVGTAVSVLQERSFRLTVKVVKSPTFFEDLGKRIADTADDFKKSITGMASALAENPSLTLISLIISILIISWKVIYKHA